MTNEELENYRGMCSVFGPDKDGNPGQDMSTSECTCCKEQDSTLWEACKDACENPPPPDEQAVEETATEPERKEEVTEEATAKAAETTEKKRGVADVIAELLLAGPTTKKEASEKVVAATGCSEATASTQLQNALSYGVRFGVLTKDGKTFSPVK